MIQEAGRWFDANGLLLVNLTCPLYLLSVVIAEVKYERAGKDAKIYKKFCLNVWQYHNNYLNLQHDSEENALLLSDAGLCPDDKGGVLLPREKFR